jgi:hypothetical protein
VATQDLERKRRLGRNQSLYRRVNESIEELNEGFAFVIPYPAFVCECANTGCIQQIQLDIAEYEQVRRSPVQFAIYPDTSHLYPDAERVVFQNDRYWIVEKMGAARAVSEELDPRS